MIKASFENRNEDNHALYHDNNIAFICDVTTSANWGNTIMLDGILWAMVINGHTRLTINSSEVVLNPGDIFVCKPRTILENGLFSADFEMRAIFMRTAYAEDIARATNIDWSALVLASSQEVFHTDEEQRENILSFFNMLVKKHKEKDTRFKEDTIKSLLKAMFYQFSDIIENNSHELAHARYNSAQNIFQRFLSMLNDDKYTTYRSVNDFADELNISPKYFSSVCKKISGKTASNLINANTMTKAYAMLHDNSLSIKQISTKLGFTNQSHFGKYFRNLSGMSPQQYRDKV